jgi:hypothetical protein
MKRTPDEKIGFKNAMAILKSHPDWKLYTDEIHRIREATMASMYKSSGEDLAKVAGVLHGFDICLGIDNLV